ncbi:protein transport protein Sec24B isoform X2 [Denticeps clupeoides]|uniref:protein transport protein Sec24B isoform X2 n=1 Tax=Denticeps clupeoides TaxID=299321 RepID=UPI0010A4C65E|nr:protein transport protein Sec24B-like isoform X2 [Denticeps clupeoides]
MSAPDHADVKSGSRYQNGPSGTCSPVYPAASYYGAPPQQSSISSAPNKAPVLNSGCQAVPAAPAAPPSLRQPGPYTNSTPPAAPPSLRQPGPYTNSIHGLQNQPGPYTNSGPPSLRQPGPYPNSTAPPSLHQPGPYTNSTAPPSLHQPGPYTNSIHGLQNQPGPYTNSAPPSLHQPGSYINSAPQQPNLVAASSTLSNGAPLYPIVSYPSAPGSSQFGTLRSCQALSGPGPVQDVLAPSAQGNGPSAPAAVNGQNNALQTPTQQQHSYGDRPLSGTPSTSVHSSPSHHQGLQYGYVTNCGVSAGSAPSATPAGHTSSSSDDEEEDDDDEEAGGDSSSSTTTGSASPVPNSYESLEGGGFHPDPASVPPPGDPSRHAPPYAYTYPAMQPAYIQTAPRSDPPHGYQQAFPSMSELYTSLGGVSAVPELTVEGLRPVNLLQERSILPPSAAPPPEPNLSADLRKVNCSPETFRCTLTNLPQTQALLNKARLPLGLLLHPFRDLQQLPVITSNTIVRCRSCRTYINPFVSFLDQRRWKCNLCYRVNDVPDEFMYNPVTRSYGEPHKRPEVQNSTVEFIASSDYMLRPPQPAVYLFVLDVSHNAVEAGYLNVFCQCVLENLDRLPGDARTRVGFLTFDSTLHFYNLQEGLSQPQMLVVSDIEDVFLPTNDSLLVNLKESKELVMDLLNALPGMFSNTQETHSALGPALQAAYKLMSPTGGRVSVFQTQLPTLGAGFLHSREDPNQRSSTKAVQHLGPATDFYKKLALDCSGQQIGVDLFLLSSQYSDLASLACISKYSAGSIFYYPTFHHIHNPTQREKLQRDLQRYLTRKIGFEAVMRIRCTKGLSIHTFHGNFFVRSTDLLSLANVNPDSGFAVQMSIDESLADTSLACFQAALLYTSCKGKRRIRVHTLCLPVVSQLSDVFAGADVQAITCLLANMAIDRCVTSSVSDARDALVNAVVDSLAAYRNNGSNLQPAGLIAPAAMRLFPLYILALLKQKALRTGTSTRLDDRVFAMCEFKSQPLQHVMQTIHPDLYRLDSLSELGALHHNETVVPPRLQLSAEKLTRDGAFLLDCGSMLYLWVGTCCNEAFIRDVLGFPNHASIPPNMTQIPDLENWFSERTRAFLCWLQESRSFCPSFCVVKDDSSAKTCFFQHLIEDRTESAFSYYEFLLHIQQQLSK